MAAVDVAALRPKPSVPLKQAMPRQERGARPARPLPYSLQVHAETAADRIALTFVNDGSAGAAFSLWSAQADEGPWFYTVGAGERLVAEHPLGADGYDLTVQGPNGFLRRFAGAAGEEPVVEAVYDPASGRILLTLKTSGAAQRLTVTPGVYRHGAARVHALEAGGTVVDAWPLARTAHWYDLIVTSEADPRWLRRLSGHLETGRPSLSDPAMGLGAVREGES